jgi:hypothetical protein
MFMLAVFQPANCGFQNFSWLFKRSLSDYERRRIQRTLDLAVNHNARLISSVPENGRTRSSTRQGRAKDRHPDGRRPAGAPVARE